MKLDIKYKFDDEVYVVYKEDDVVRIFKGKIVEFSMSKDYGLHYYVDNSGDDYVEQELIAVDRDDLLIERINKLLEE